MGFSRYSDLSPYRIRVSYEGEVAPNFDALYLAKDRRLRNRHLDNKGSPALYQNQIVRASPGKLDLFLSCGQRFKTLLLGDRGPFRVEFDSGSYDPESSTPGRGGVRIGLTSNQLGDRHVVDFRAATNQMICGYPTNFSKKGRLNYCHVQHIVGLIYLSVAARMNDETRNQLLHWAKLWHDSMEEYAVAEAVSFADPQDVLDGINRGKVLIQLEDWEIAKAVMADVD